MEFRLTYAGPLYARQRDPEELGKRPRHADNVHCIRQNFHAQLKNLWADLPRRHKKADQFIYDESFPRPMADAEALAKRYDLYGFNFVPLVTQELDLLCNLDILFLRYGKPGDVIWPGDIDNRLKVLLDALRIPEANEDYIQRKAEPGEEPFFCLLEDDKLITKVAVETDNLLEPMTKSGDVANVHLIITVQIRPYDVTPFNIHFA